MDRWGVSSSVLTKMCVCVFKSHKRRLYLANILYKEVYRFLTLNVYLNLTREDFI